MSSSVIEGENRQTLFITRLISLLNFHIQTNFHFLELVYILISLVICTQLHRFKPSMNSEENIKAKTEEVVNAPHVVQTGWYIIYQL